MEDEKSIDAMHDELNLHKEMYVPKIPLKFDQTGKMLIYETQDKVSDRTNLKRIGVLPLFVIYCGIRAV